MNSQRAKFDIRIKRVYEKASPDDGARFLVDGPQQAGEARAKEAGLTFNG